MEKFWQKAESLWHESPIIAWVLVLLGIGLALWIGFFPQSPGIAIGLLATVAGIMSVRIERIHPSEKFAWVALLVIFAVLEVLAIGRADKANEAAKKQQNKEFRAIADGLTRSYAQSQEQFGQTMEGVGKVFDKTRQAADTAKEAVNTITGGKGFSYIQLATVDVLGKKTNQLVPMLTVRGTQILRGVSIRVVDYKAFEADTRPLESIESIVNRDATNTTLGDIKVGTSPLFQQIGIVSEGKENIDYLINFFALNGTWIEEMHYRHINGTLEYANRVVWLDFPQNGNADLVRRRVVFQEISKGYSLDHGQVSWVEPLKQPRR